jgi:hypothetical protein
MDIKTTNVNRILETYGLKHLATEPERAVGPPARRVLTGWSDFHYLRARPERRQG